MKTSEEDPLSNPEFWYDSIGPGRNKPEKPLDQCIRGTLRWSAEQWKVNRLADRAAYLHLKIKDLEERLTHYEKEDA